MISLCPITPEMNIHCPVCGTVSEMIFNPEQAFCTNENCVVVTFNPSLADGGLSDAKPMRVESWPL
jgi:hypothetical protein